MRLPDPPNWAKLAAIVVVIGVCFAWAFWRGG